MTAALAGLKVLDLSRVLAGPWAAMTLGDLGADVIKVEPPEGDDTRALGPPFRAGCSAYFACANRNKRSIVLDLKDAAARPLINALIGWADVLIENFRTGVAEQLGVGYATASAHNPRLIYCSISGYGRDGPMARRAGYDFVIQAEAGMMAITGEVDGPPMKVGVAVADLAAGQNATVAILAALQARHRDGHGQQIDISLFDSQLQMLANVASNALFTDSEAKRYGNAHASIVPYQTFAAADGEFAVAVASPRLWSQFCAAIGLPALSEDPRFHDNPARVTHREALLAILQPLFRSRPQAHWLQRLQAAEVPSAAILGVAAALQHPLVDARGLRIELAGLPMLASPLRLAATPVSYRAPPPTLDADRASILAELGLAEPAPTATGTGAYR